VLPNFCFTKAVAYRAANFGVFLAEHPAKNITTASSTNPRASNVLCLMPANMGLALGAK
ncbi:uncharacterized protein METZ01_LOCUS91874, partial [marine metagenome]